MTPEQQIENLLKTADPVAIKQMLNAAHAAELRASYASHLKADDGSSNASLAVKDWGGIKLLLAEVPGRDNNPGGTLFQPLLDDVKAAIAAKDAGRLLLNLLLIYKAVGR